RDARAELNHSRPPDGRLLYISSIILSIHAVIVPCLPCSVESATQTLHRLPPYQPGRDWDEAVVDPRIVQDLEANDMSRLPWFVKRYAEQMPVTPLPRELPATTEPTVAVLAGTADVTPAPLDLPNLSR